ncbi:GFP-like fluorescent chromoprotein amFP486 isoform X1 [Branchiostoma floridae x Branchiostoma belcheri]
MPYMSSIVRSALTFQSIPTSHDLHIHGSINGLEFDMVGGGSGNPKDGSVESRVTSTKGDLPAFSPHIVAPHLGFGFYQYLPFPGGPSPYQAAIDVGGKYNEHRTIQFEDGAVLTANYRYTYKGDKIKGDFHLVGSGFPASGPVMTNSLASLDRTVAKITCVDEHSLVDNIDWTYRTSSGGSYRAMVLHHVIQHHRVFATAPVTMVTATHIHSHSSHSELRLLNCIFSFLLTAPAAAEATVPWCYM